MRESRPENGASTKEGEPGRLVRENPGSWSCYLKTRSIKDNAMKCPTSDISQLAGGEQGENQGR